MQFKTVSAAAGPYDAALRVLPAGAPVRFCDQALQAAWQAHLGGDPLTLEHRQVLTLRLPLLGGFTTLLLAGFDAGVPAPMDAFRSLWARLGALLAECRASNVFLDALNDAGAIPADKVLEAEWSLADHDGTNRYGVAVCKIAMLPEPLVRKYYDAGLLEIDDWEWTITPNAGNAYYVRNVYSDGSLDWNYAYSGSYGVRPALFVDSEICLSLEPDEVDLSDSAMLRDFTSKQLVEEVLRRIAAGENDDEDE